MSAGPRAGRRRAASIAAVVLATATTLLWLLAAPASAESSTVGTSGEAWYTVLPTCTAVPETCLPKDTVPPVQPFTAGTLHVARVAGTELARAYLKLDLEKLPIDATITGGTLTLPIASDQTAGTFSPESAHIQACFMVNDFLAGAFGELTAAPEPDCFSSATAKLVTLQSGSSFVIDLAPFVQRWTEGETNNGIALVPAPQEPPDLPALPVPPPVPVPAVDETWHVAFNGADAAATEKISATITYVLRGADLGPPAPLPPVIVPGIPGYFVPGAQLPPVVAPPQVPTRQIPTVLVATRGFQYAAVFVLPLLGLAIGTAVSYSLTRELDLR